MPGPPVRQSVREATFDTDSVGEVTDLLRNTRLNEFQYKVVFSYKTFHERDPSKKGTGSNRRVTMVKTALNEAGLSVHMRNGKDDLAAALRREGKDVDDDEWFLEWMVAAKNAELVVCFIDDDYLRSKACMKELNYCKDEKLPSMKVNYKDTPCKDVATLILNRHRENKRRG